MSLRRIAAAGFVLGVTACTSVRPVQPDPFIPIHTPGVVWVTYPDSTVVPVAAPGLTGDTLRGLRPGTSEPVAISMHEIRSVRAKTPDHLKTALFLTTLGVGAVSAVYVLWISQAGSNRDGVYCGVYTTARFGDPSGAPMPYC